MQQTATFTAGYKIVGNSNNFASFYPTSGQGTYDRYVRMYKNKLSACLTTTTVKAGKRLIYKYKDDLKSVTEQESIILRNALVNSVELVSVGKLVE